jgi:hypothetical protein
VGEHPAVPGGHHDLGIEEMVDAAQDGPLTGFRARAQIGPASSIGAQHAGRRGLRGGGRRRRGPPAAMPGRPRPG